MDRSKTLERVRKMLDKASDPGCTEAEAEAFRSKADELMIRYAIHEAELERSSGKRTEDPISKSILVTDGGVVIRRQLGDLLHVLARHNRCRSVSHGMDLKDSDPLYFTVVGFPADIQFVEMIFTNMRMEIAKNMWPNANPDMNYEDNLIMLKESGLKWEQIHERLFKAGILDRPFTRNLAVKFTKDYTNACAKQGRERMYVQPTTHQRSWMAGFIDRVDLRLQENRRRADEQLWKATNNSRGTDLVLRDRKHRVGQKFNQLFPPKQLKSVKARSTKIAGGSYRAGDQAGQKVSLGEGRLKPRPAIG